MDFMLLITVCNDEYFSNTSDCGLQEEVIAENTYQ